MTPRTLLFGIAVLTVSNNLAGQSLDQAEVRLPYSELKELLARGQSPAKPPPARPALLGLRIRLEVVDGRPVLEASFRATSIGDGLTLIPLIGGDVSLEHQEPAEAVLVGDGDSLCLAVEEPGLRQLQLRLLPIVNKERRFTLTLPACPSAIFETGALPADTSVVLETGPSEETLGAGQLRPLTHAGQTLGLRLLDPQETREALRPPEPSTWTWQNQTLVKPEEDALIYHTLASASAGGGSGVAALLPLPSDAQDVTVNGEDLASHAKLRGDKRSLTLQLGWKTRGILDRQILLTYRLPLRPLDRVWHLQAPGDESTRTRFLIATSPLLAYAAAELSDPIPAQGLPTALAAAVDGGMCVHLEAATTAELAITRVPVAATAEGVVTKAEWALKLEPDGAMLTTGLLQIDHTGPLGFVFDTPPGMKLLSCETGGKPVSPVDLGEGLLKVALTPQAGKSLLSCSFTGRSTPLDPVEGTLMLALPKVALFIESLLWHLELPPAYQAETHGNLTRGPVAGGAPPSRISLRKNLCRDERPEIHLFYQRSDIPR